MKIIKSSLCLLLICYISHLSAQQYTYSVDTTRSGSEMLFGQITPDDFQQSPFNTWYSENYSAYESDQDITSKMKKQLDKHDITIYMGTWCGDSRKEVPAVIKYLKSAGYDMDQLTIVALDQQKQARDRREIGHNIHRVPTIIFSKDGKEKGRIIEHPVSSIAEDIRQIVSTNNYKPNYYGLEVIHQAISEKGFEVLKDSKFLSEVKSLTMKDYELSKYGVIYFRNHEYDKAFSIYDFNAKLFPESERPFYSLGASYYQLGDFANARSNFEQVLKIKPEHKYAKQYLTMVADAEQLASKK